MKKPCELSLRSKREVQHSKRKSALRKFFTSNLIKAQASPAGEAAQLSSILIKSDYKFSELQPQGNRLARPAEMLFDPSRHKAPAVVALLQPTKADPINCY